MQPTKRLCGQSNRQVEPPLPLIFSCRIFRGSARAPNFSIDPFFWQGRYGLRNAHSPECGKATAVSVTFHPVIVAENLKCGSRCLICGFLYCSQVCFTVVEGAGDRTRFAKIGSFAPPLSRNTRHRSSFYLPMPALTPSTRWPRCSSGRATEHLLYSCCRPTYETCFYSKKKRS